MSQSRYERIHVAFFVIIAVLASGCASTQATVTVRSQPDGAYFTSVSGTGYADGIGPVTAYYNFSDSTPGKNGCYRASGFKAQWVSGASATIKTLELCGSPVGSYEFTFSRPQSAPGLDKDMQFALQLQAQRNQEEQAKNAAALQGVAALLGQGTSATTQSHVHMWQKQSTMHGTGAYNQPVTACTWKCVSDLTSPHQTQTQGLGQLPCPMPVSY